MDNTEMQSLNERKKNRLKEIRRRFFAAIGIKISSEDDLPKARGIPRRFCGLDPERLDVKGRMLKVFRDVIDSIEDPTDRVMAMKNLNVFVNSIRAPKASHIVDRPVYLRQRLCREIYEGVTGQPYTMPAFVSLMNKEDRKNKKFFELIDVGVYAYLVASPEKQVEFKQEVYSKIKRFNEALLPNVKKENVAAHIISQQTR